MLLTLMVFEHERQVLLFPSWRPLRHSFVLYLATTGAVVGLVTISLRRTRFVAII